MDALLLAAGYGTRLYPITKDTPKPLLEVGERPMLEHILEKLKPVTDLEQVYVVTNDKFYGDFREWNEESDWPWPVSILNDGTREDDRRLGAIGDIQFTIEEAEVDADLFVLAGDNLFDFSLVDMVETFDRKNSNVVGVYRFPDESRLSKYGIVDTDEDGRVLSFEEKPEDPPSNLVSMAMYLFPKQKLHLVNRYLESGGNPDEPGWYMSWLVEHDNLYAHPFDGNWFDIGDKESLQEAREFVSERGGSL